MEQKYIHFEKDDYMQNLIRDLCYRYTTITLLEESVSSETKKLDIPLIGKFVGDKKNLDRQKGTLEHNKTMARKSEKNLEMLIIKHVGLNSVEIPKDWRFLYLKDKFLSCFPSYVKKRKNKGRIVDAAVEKFKHFHTKVCVKSLGIQEKNVLDRTIISDVKQPLLSKKKTR